ncbi:unnamed protein product [Phytophthora lilii]|uniref:Unnamed protein product n=1 Tax=Phytophthora lilii TaxID=2077276 RepID=A0A9W6TRG6_9STRA|nr:unnamed protein product [Phytophthora lilii]
MHRDAASTATNDAQVTTVSITPGRSSRPPTTKRRVTAQPTPSPTVFGRRNGHSVIQTEVTTAMNLEILALSTNLLVVVTANLDDPVATHRTDAIGEGWNVANSSSCSARCRVLVETENERYTTSKCRLSSLRRWPLYLGCGDWAGNALYCILGNKLEDKTASRWVLMDKKANVSVVVAVDGDEYEDESDGSAEMAVSHTPPPPNRQKTAVRRTKAATRVVKAVEVHCPVTRTQSVGDPR